MTGWIVFRESDKYLISDETNRGRWAPSFNYVLSLVSTPALARHLVRKPMRERGHTKPRFLFNYCLPTDAQFPACQFHQPIYHRARARCAGNAARIRFCDVAKFAHYRKPFQSRFSARPFALFHARKFAKCVRETIRTVLQFLYRSSPNTLYRC